MRQITRSAKQRWRQDERRACYRSPNRQLAEKVAARRAPGGRALLRGSTTLYPSPVRQEVAFLVSKPEAHFVLQMAFPGPAPRVSVTNPQSHFLPYRKAISCRTGIPHSAEQTAE